MQTKLIHSVSLFDGELRPNSWALLSDLETQIGSGSTWRELSLAEHTEIIDGHGGVLLAGFVDTHCHGGGGFSAQGGLDQMRRVLDFNQSQGVLRSALSLVTAPVAELISLCEQATELSEDPRFLGLHLEGPYLSHAHPGAHNPAFLCKPDVKDLQKLLAHDSVLSITVAPELLGQAERQVLRDSGKVVCVGHTAIDYQGAHEFFTEFPQAVVTHAFNGMRSIHHREPGLVPAAIERGIFTELIADTVHVHPAVAKLVPSAKTILITDATAAAGMPDGDYALGSLSVNVSDGVARTATGSLAGSTLTLRTAVQNYSQWFGDKLSALRAATTNPANAYDFDLPSLSLRNHLLLP